MELTSVRCSPRSGLRGSDLQRSQTRWLARGATHQIWAPHQPKNRQGARCDRASYIDFPRRWLRAQGSISNAWRPATCPAWSRWLFFIKAAPDHDQRGGHTAAERSASKSSLDWAPKSESRPRVANGSSQQLVGQRDPPSPCGRRARA